ncbi:Radical SAM family enzyme, similar to coproporphyrinogen III oxidase, oxygen-independent, clustered with nucleoside-triphosphatase RdgB [hydrothermal vent metagenome]|uniref:Radical SAM family enzyme, similar to coproporphyrinogen III oxidase, oxygen-independent, clustered with nucleoside-triphosphatase RdgB n=1 Tax=hydrothermal vent metagenome TaxID=652676 RepID=A0A1W1DXN4_9ZZZZ
MTLPPLSLYIHYPWCVKKCPYCDFNSHEQKADNDIIYMQAVLADLKNQLKTDLIQGRTIQTIFFGGGTPSLCSIEAMEILFSGLKETLTFTKDIEITLEANPGASDREKFSALKGLGVNRLSIGVQSFNDEHLKKLGRIHSSQQAIETVKQAQAVGFDNINIDLMFGFEKQTVAECLSDIQQAITLEPAHISFYQLTIEPNTFFAKHPPILSQETNWEMQEQGHQILEKAGFTQYEISAFSNRPAKHNLNYWQFGDYLGIGAGAHGKITIDGKIIRTLQSKSPKDFIENNQNKITKVEQVGFEFMLNALRLKGGFNSDLFIQRTGQSIQTIQQKLDKAQALGLLELNDKYIQPSEKGFNFLNDLQVIFL